MTADCSFLHRALGSKDLKRIDWGSRGYCGEVYRDDLPGIDSLVLPQSLPRSLSSGLLRRLLRASGHSAFTRFTHVLTHMCYLCPDPRLPISHLSSSISNSRTVLVLTFYLKLATIYRRSIINASKEDEQEAIGTFPPRPALSAFYRMMQTSCTGATWPQLHEEYRVTVLGF